MSEAGGARGDEGAFRTIGDVAEELHVPQHVLRFWETRFPEVKPLKRAGGRRLYRPEDVALLRAVQTLLYADGYTIRGVQKLLAEFGAGHVAGALARSAQRDGRGEGAAPPRRPPPQDARRDGTPSDPPRTPARSDVADRLRTALDDLSECLRLLAPFTAPRT